MTTNKVDQNMYAEEEDEDDLEGEEEEEEEETDEDDEEEDEEEPQHKKSDLHAVLPITTITAIEKPIITANFFPDHKRIRIIEPSPSLPMEEKKPPLTSCLDDSRRLFQRLWTDEDEIGLLKGFLEFTTQRGFKNSAYHHDTAPFYDQIKSRLQLEFNKNQLVEKLRRLKKKYRNVMNRISSGKDFSFKSSHDHATFEISKKIWSGIAGGIDDEEGGLASEIANEVNISNPSEKKISTSSSSKCRKKHNSRGVEENVSEQANCALPNVIEDAVKSCLAPLIKELVGSGSNGARVFGSMGVSPIPSSFGGEKMDEKWKKQQILELEVYAKRMELVQEQIKLALEELKSGGGR